MCGIIGVIAKRDVTPILLEGLKSLEYRGYDSAGMAVLDTEETNIQILRVAGKVMALADLLDSNPLEGHMGIAHTRWATHGQPTTVNAHPHCSHSQIAIVHNGIIENYKDLREQLRAEGYIFETETDTEVVAHLLHFELQQRGDMLPAIFAAQQVLKGAYALGIINKQLPDCLYAVRQGCPLVIGLGIGEHFIASDSLALLPVTQRFIYLEEGDVAEVRTNNVAIFDQNNHKVMRIAQKSEANVESISKGSYRHFMQKEIFDQPVALTDTLHGRLTDDGVPMEIFGHQAAQILPQVKRIHIVACGTSYHAGLVARHWLEEYAGIPCQVEIASEYRYRQVVVEPETLLVTLSQSGETADTLAALRRAKELGYLATLGICNAAHSAMVRETDLVFLTHAGVEIGVAATKTFTTQLLALLMLTVAMAQQQQMLDVKTIIADIKTLPSLACEILKLDGQIQNLAQAFADKKHALFLGRGGLFPIALEGALKLKEISYIHAEAYPAGELKHGALALVDDEMPVIIMAPNNALTLKLQSNIEEVQSRGGKMYIFADQTLQYTSNSNVQLINIPPVSNLLAPIVYTLPLQLLAYHVAVLKGTDVDQPRNLAKSVTVE